MKAIYCEIFEILANSKNDVKSWNEEFLLRKNAKSFVKVAFDSRRINQEEEYNPRRGLQNYNRSESFISQGMKEKVENLNKLRDVLGEIKSEYGRSRFWQDSNSRVLLGTLESGLRSNIGDGDYSDNQNSMGSINYIEQLLDVRYRISPDNLKILAAPDLKKIILSKDSELNEKNIIPISKSDISGNSYDSLLNKLFDGIKATEENPDIERIITISIRDKFHK